ncbi:MAG: hypothetical protein KGY76_02400 [Candidatus Thermoplasmatota archaeon]|nr:hypothetical protein [Candidatus Thermoplasmatota archaeon]
MMPKLAKIFIILLGFVFIVIAIGISLVFNYLDLVSMGMGIIGIFLIILPFTYHKEK